MSSAQIDYQNRENGYQGLGTPILERSKEHEQPGNPFTLAFVIVFLWLT
jgi:hypothetical protein